MEAQWPKMDRRDGISGMFNQSLEARELLESYTPAQRLHVQVTYGSEECNLCVCLLTQALCSEPREGHVPPPSQFQFLVKVNTV